MPCEHVAEADAQVGAIRIGARGSEARGIRIDEAEAAVVRVHRARDQAFAAAALHFEPRIGAHAQRDVGAVEAALGVAFLVAVRGEADLDVVVDPHVRLAAGRDRVDLREARRVFVADHQVRSIAAERAAAHEQPVVDGRVQRLGEHDAALQIVDVVVEHRTQVDHAADQARILVAQLDAQALGADQDVLVAQEVQRAAGAAELLAARQRAGLGGEAVDREALLAEARGRPRSGSAGCRRTGRGRRAPARCRRS